MRRIEFSYGSGLPQALSAVWRTAFREVARAQWDYDAIVGGPESAEEALRQAWLRLWRAERTLDRISDAIDYWE